ncbi:MAG TPA: protein kinase [Vicinamibacterales bacterium]|nr:protein kinase [Vicinamibacterales bacterium]
MQLSRAGDTKRFAPYEVRAPLGSGGMGEVYRAWDPRLHREVALKIVREHAGSDPNRVRRFVAEARAASALNHPNILTVFDADVDGSTPYIVSELIDGNSLRDEIRNGPLPLKRLLDLGAQIADGLAEAHAAGIVHRDLKPENIMITRAGRAKILDFGLALPTGFAVASQIPTTLDGKTLTEPGLLVGTVPYMSPEQARGLPTDFRSDQFSLGLILYEMATGQAAFRRDTPAATLDAIVNEEPLALATRSPHLPFVLWWIVERCLAKNPAERYGVTADLHHDLRTLRDRLPEASRREVSVKGGRSTSAFRRIAVAILILALAGAVTVAWRLARDVPSVDLTDVRFRAIATGAVYEGLPALSPDGQVVAYAQDMDGVLQIFTRRLSADTAARVTSSAYDCKHPFWSPDGKRLYYVSLARQREGLWSIGAAGGTPEVVVENATRAAISPDGRTLAFLRDEQRADTIGTAALWLSTPEGVAPWSTDAVERAARRHDPLRAARFIEAALAFSPNGKSLGLCGVPGTREERMWQFWIIPLPNGEPHRQLQWWSDAGPRNTSFTWFPDSRHIALGVTSLSTPGSHLWIADLNTDRAWPLTRGADSESYPSVSAAGDRIVFTRGEPDYDLLQIPLMNGASSQPLLATPQNESDPALSPDGKVLAYVTDRNGQDEIWRRTIDGGFDQPLITQREFGDDRTVMLSSPAFSPDGRRIAYQRNGFKPRWPLRIWISLVEGGAAAPLLPASYEGIQSAPTWSPDGQWIAFAQWKDRQWELAKVRVGSGEGPVVLRRDGVANATPHWSPGNPDWITWETASGVVLVSPDGRNESELSNEQWLVHTWSRDGSEVLGIKETDDLRLSLVALKVETKTERILADLGPSFAFNNPIKGLTLMPGGRAVATSIVRSRGDLWLAEGIKWRRPQVPMEKP